jgi:hypothetical protein
LSSGAKWCVISLSLIFCYGDEIVLIDDGLSCISLGIGKKFLHIVGFYFLFQGCSWLKPLEEYKGIHPPPSLSLLFDWLSHLQRLLEVKELTLS